MVFKYRIAFPPWIIGALLICCAETVVANSGLIAGTHVSRNANVANITIRFNCHVSYLSHQPSARGDRLRILIEPTGICSGVSPRVADSREQHRPAGADQARLVDIEYDGEFSSEKVVTLNFSEEVGFDVADSGTTATLTIRVYLDAPPVAAEAAPPKETVVRRRVTRQKEPADLYEINLESSLSPTAIANLPDLALGQGRTTYLSEIVLDGATWYRIRVGYFTTVGEATSFLDQLKEQYPGAWIDKVKTDSTRQAKSNQMPSVKEIGTDSRDLSVASGSPQLAASGAMTEQKLQSLMNDARRAMTAGEIARAIQIYTKVLQHPGHDFLPQAQEYLALARERNGQIAHAKAEYQRYLALYPDGDGAVRVNQRLSALLARDSDGKRLVAVTTPGRQRNKSRPSDWKFHTFFSQYYRRDVNQLNEQSAVISQSSIYSDINLDARRRGERFDFSARVSAGYRSDLMNENEGPGDDIRISYAYADIADAKTNLRGRIGRQSRNTGGVLGRFDGLNFAYQATERILINTVAGKPVNSSSDGIDDDRQFYGLSANYGPIAENLELGVFYIQQDVNGIIDRQAIGAEMRYFDARRSLWGLIDYDTSYSELGSYFLQGSWRFDSHLTINGSIDHRLGPFLSTSNALIGQPFSTIEELRGTLTDDEIRQLALDRTSRSTTYTLGVSSPLTPKLQINANVTQASIEGTPGSGGVAATLPTNYNYYSTSLVASSLIREGDVSIIGLRYSESSTTKVQSLSLDSRFPLKSGLRINPRLRVDRREILSDSSVEWIYSPRLRLQYRWGRKFRLEFEAGKQFANRELEEFDMDRESYFMNLGYQVIF